MSIEQSGGHELDAIAASVPGVQQVFSTSPALPRPVQTALERLESLPLVSVGGAEGAPEVTVSIAVSPGADVAQTAAAVADAVRLARPGAVVHVRVGRVLLS